MWGSILWGSASPPRNAAQEMTLDSLGPSPGRIPPDGYTGVWELGNPLFRGQQS